MLVFNTYLLLLAWAVAGWVVTIIGELRSAAAGEDAEERTRWPVDSANDP